MATFHQMQTASANAIARSFVRDAVETRREDAMRFLAAMEHALSLGIDAGAGGLDEIALRVQDSMSDLIGGMAKDLDDVGLCDDGAMIDMSELDALITTIRSA